MPALTLDPHFQFSQHSLGDFADCPRRFYLRYIAKQRWPLVITGPNGLDALTYQAYLKRGALLHTWIERYFLGVTKADAPHTEDGNELAVWWQRFSQTDLSPLPAQRLPELELVAPIGEHTLYARFDVLALDTEQFVIVDWKTLRSESPLPHSFFQDRLQTRAYLYVLATAGAPFNNGTPIAPQQCSMRYWLANFPAQAWQNISYSQAEYERDAARLKKLIDSATTRNGEPEFEKTLNEKHCKYCTYRTLCNRAEIEGELLPDENAGLIDLDDIPTLDY